MAEDEEQERQGPRPANDNGSPNGMSLDPRILRIACSTPKEDCKVRDIFPAFVHGAESLRDNSLIVAKSESLYERRGERHPMPARMQATAEDKQTAEDRPTRDYLETTRAFWQPYAERELTREDAREMARNLIWLFRRAARVDTQRAGASRCGVVETASSSPRRKRGRPRTRAAAKDKMQP